MATAAYYQWVSVGKPLTPCVPIRQVVERLKVAYPKAAAKNLFSWYANDAHYEAEPAQDHTPFSQTGWPLPSPWYVVFATDIMHRPDLGVDCNVLFAYWIAEARAGRMRWLKYLIWQGKSYDVRNEWAPRSASGHFDHIHMSTRTDHRDTHLGSWSVTPEEENDLGTLDGQQGVWLYNTAMFAEYASRGADSYPARTGDNKPITVDLKPYWERIAAEVAKNPVGTVTVDVDEAAIAKAVNDDAAARLAD